MSGRNGIDKRLRDLRFRMDAETHDRILSDALRVQADARKTAPKLYPAVIGRLIMTRFALKLSLAGIAVVVAIALFAPFGTNGLVLADVLEQIQGSSYRFDLTIRLGNAHKTVLGRVYQQGRARFDDKVGAGTVSTIVDLESRQSLLLFHQFKSARYMEGAEELTNTGADQLLLLCSRPIEELWRLRDGSEEDLGERSIDGVTVRGFRVTHEDEYFRNETTLWAEVKTARPVTIEIVSTARKPPRDELVFELRDLVVDAEMDASDFSLDVPADYTLSDQTRLEDVEFNDESSPEAKKITQAFELWDAGKADETVATLLTVDWDGAIVFAKEPYLLTLTERDIIELEQDEQEAIMPIVLGSCNTLRKICFECVDRAKAARSAKDYATAEQHLETALHLGELLNRDPEGMFIVQLTGIAARKLALVQLKALYEEMGAPEKLVATEQKIQQVDAAHQTLRKRATGR